jgi:hypothetical protein
MLDEVEAKYNVILEIIIIMIKKKHISKSCDKVTTINNQSSLHAHVYVKENWERISILPNLQRLETIVIFYNLTSLSAKSLVEYYGCLNGMDIANKISLF